ISTRFALLLAAVLLLAACSANSGTAPGGNIRADAPPQAVDEPAESDVAGGQASPAEQAEPAAVLPIAELPDSGIALYPLGEEGVSEEGVELVIGEQRQRLDWRYTTPRQIMPAMQAVDYDNDGKDELAVVLNVGSG